MFSTKILLAPLLFLLLLHSSFVVGGITVATTPHLREIVVGRCSEAIIVNTDVMTNVSSTAVDCARIYENFASVWVSKASSSVSLADFEPFFNELPNELLMAPRDKSLFWSNTDRVAHVLSNNFPQNFVTLEDTVLGRALNRLTFCGCTGEDNSTSLDCVNGVDYKELCPFGQVLSSNETLGAMVSFWAQSSRRFAANARGDVHVLLSAHHGTAYKTASFFAGFELPNLSTPNITSLQILLLKNDSIGETCTSGSILKLKEDVKRRFEETGVALPPITCVDDYATLKYIVCADTPESKECAFVTLEGQTSPRKRIIVFSFGFFFMGSVVGVVCVFLTLCIVSSFQKKSNDLKDLRTPLTAL